MGSPNSASGSSDPSADHMVTDAGPITATRSDSDPLSSSSNPFKGILPILSPPRLPLPFSRRSKLHRTKPASQTVKLPPKSKAKKIAGKMNDSN
ncbi:hypothetical protein LINPERHAP1_LOCUS29404 [Linum perenne]